MTSSFILLIFTIAVTMLLITKLIVICQEVIKLKLITIIIKATPLFTTLAISTHSLH